MNKPLTIEDFKLTPDEMKELVEGAQKFLPPVPEEGENLSVDADEKPSNS